MNKAYKVVFNKARGALMVANEVTSSVQKKGVKTVIATALFMGAAAGACAADVANTTYSSSTNLTDEDIVFAAPSNQTITNFGDNLNKVAIAVDGTKLTILNTSSVTFKSTNAATNDESKTNGTGHNALGVFNGGDVTISTKVLNVGAPVSADGATKDGGDRGIRLVGSKNKLTILADEINAYVGDEFVHVRKGSGDSVANIGTADQRIKKFYGGWGKNDFGVALLQANEGNTINFYAVDATFDGPTRTEGGVFGSGSKGTVNVDVSGKLTIDGNICGTYGEQNDKRYKSDIFFLNVNASDLEMKGAWLGMAIRPAFERLLSTSTPPARSTATFTPTPAATSA